MWQKYNKGVTFKNGRICVKVDDAQSPFQIGIQDGLMTSGDPGKSSLEDRAKFHSLLTDKFSGP
jgi:hypothetical protein